MRAYRKRRYLLAGADTSLGKQSQIVMASDSVVIKAIAPSEFNKVAVLEHALHPDAWQANALFELYHQPSINFMALGAYDNAQLVGYLLAQCVDNAELLRLGVAKSYQGQGIAKRLMHQWLDGLLHSDPLSVAILEVRTDNTPAVKLYHQFGFAVIHTRKGYYRIGKQSFDAYVMQWQGGR